MNVRHEKQGMWIGWMILISDPLHDLQPYSMTT